MFLTRTGVNSSIAPLVTVLICTYNRAALLAETLESLANQSVSTAASWEVLVVDNCSTDNTADVVRASQAAFPVPLRYLFERRQGKSYALNTGIVATASTFVLFTDDDVRVSPQWVEASVGPMLADHTIQYTGGPVHPIWETPPPVWLGRDSPELWGAIAILDYGPSAFVFEDQGRIPIGANMAVRRTLLDLVGLFDTELGRRGSSLLGQEQAEFFCRARAVGVRGTYVPAMSVHHHVPRLRLTRRYFRRWWLWKGISRARLHRAHPSCDGQSLSKVRRIAGVPLFTLREMLRHARNGLARRVRGDIRSAVHHEMMVAYYAGYAWEDWRHPHPSMAPVSVKPQGQGVRASER